MLAYDISVYTLQTLPDATSLGKRDVCIKSKLKAYKTLLHNLVFKLTNVCINSRTHPRKLMQHPLATYLPGAKQSTEHGGDKRKNKITEIIKAHVKCYGCTQEGAETSLHTAEVSGTSYKR